MAEGSFKGKNMKAVAVDVAEGLFTVNPLFLKKFDKDMLKDLNEHMSKVMVLVRNDKVEFSDAVALRKRNLKLQRLNNAIVVLKNIAREKKVML
ncbi:MAG: hypothetical protein A2X56_11675 [Nitrospirae bacterium GWC2_57_13]|jgi:hypothetical protein|nr:MAG: hypothetical protein A2X56_11675 [Nitrospirae bacterium GWC2_57_13]OGW44684.1 MAG: hypothetical protein A2X57_07080 [Nitrospirae bacterium GWD2_57_8]HAR46738.1 hypothetical protein [Nitrospiraceae bacterium]